MCTHVCVCIISVSNIGMDSHDGILFLFFTAHYNISSAENSVWLSVDSQ